MARSRRSSRRRQRSVRVSVAVTLLAVATVAVLLSLPTQSAPVLSASAVAALGLGWAALRIMWTEVLQSRRENSADRASTAYAYRTLFSERAAEHAEFTTAMTERLAESHTSVHELQGEVVLAQKTAAAMTVRAETAESAHATALVRVAELVRSIDLLRDEQEELDVLGETAPGSLDELIAFDEKIAEASGKHASKPAKLA